MLESPFVRDCCKKPYMHDVCGMPKAPFRANFPLKTENHIMAHEVLGSQTLQYRGGTRQLCVAPVAFAAQNAHLRPSKPVALEDKTRKERLGSQMTNDPYLARYLCNVYTHIQLQINAKTVLPKQSKTT